MQNFSIEGAISYLTNLVTSIVVLIVLGVVLFYLGKLLIIWYKNRGREKTSLDSVLLQVALPRDNEIKIDTAEQLFASLSAIGRGGMFKLPPHLSFEIVGMPGDIRFYVHTPRKLKDLVEKQINGAYPDAEIKEVNIDSIKREGMVIGNE